MNKVKIIPRFALENFIKQCVFPFGYRELNIYQILYSKKHKLKFIFKYKASYHCFLDSKK